MRWFPPLVLISLAIFALFSGPAVSLPPRPGVTAENLARSVAVRRGLAFIYTAASVPKNFADYGDDLLWCFCEIASTSADPELKSIAWRQGHDLALRWRAGHVRADRDADAGDLYELVSGAQSADCLGVPDESGKLALRDAASRLAAEDTLGFDPAVEPPPGDIPKRCRKCGGENPRGSRTCSRCRTALVMQDRYAVWCDALIVAYTGDRYGARLGGSFADVVQWRPRMPPYPEPNDTDDNEYRHAAYAITHVVYALNDYGRFHLRPDWFPAEFEFLKSHLAHSIATDDPELLGEYMDTLKSFGLTRSDPLLSAGSRYLLAHQNPDGSWGDASDPDVYNRYHATWTAIDGLRDYDWQGEGVSLPAALRSARRGPMAPSSEGQGAR